MNIRRLKIMIEPKAQKRDRIGRRGNRGHSYKHPDQERYEEDVKKLLLFERDWEMITTPFRLGVNTYHPVPKSWTKKKKALALAGKIFPIGGRDPDYSNLVKNLEDIGNGILWYDDKLVIGSLHGDKAYDDGAGPRWEIIVQILDVVEV
ncbi:RusA family crossover junction endodeoxyribonuclease [Candidatus Pacearchaeota archaeon]|nr:RusA family crossover junction endodeoxyribonuclease [Candidatus Pacearchaeota archaeon]